MAISIAISGRIYVVYTGDVCISASALQWIERKQLLLGPNLCNLF